MLWMRRFVLLVAVGTFAACSTSSSSTSSDENADAADAERDARSTEADDGGSEGRNGSSRDARRDDRDGGGSETGLDVVSHSLDARPSDGTSDASPADADAGSLPPNLSWRSRDDGQPRGRLQYPDTPDEYYEFARFEVEAPIRIHALRVQVDVLQSKDELTLYLWDDLGGNGLNFRVDAPLATVTREVTPNDTGTWLTLPLEQPVELTPGRMFYVGLIADGSKPVQLLTDASQPNPEHHPPSSLVWRSKVEGDGNQRHTASPGHFLVRVGYRPLQTVAPEDRYFESNEIGSIGLDNVSRIAFADVDDDGAPDAMLNGPRLYLNDGQGQFREVTSSWIPDDVSANGGVFGDFDNDGDPDYFATGDEDHLLEHRGDRYVDVTQKSGIDDTQTFECGKNADAKSQHAPTEAAAWLDYDGDGRLDLYQANYHCGGSLRSNSADRLWHNEGGGEFESIDLPVGRGASGDPTQAGRGVAPADADGDGDVDLFVTNYRLDPNFVFENMQGTKRAPWSDIGRNSHLIGTPTQRGVRRYYGHSIGAAWGDVNHDGRLDVFVANLAHPRYIEFSQTSSLYLNKMGAHLGALVFDDVTERADLLYRETASNPNLWDYDNDGDLDLFYTCVYEGRESIFYRNDGHPDWTEVSYRTGLEVEDGWGSATADIDLDGDLDMIAGDKAFINRNLDGRGAVFVRLVGNGAGETNRSAIGARVEATIDGRTVLRERYGAHGTGVQSSPWLHVGLGSQSKTDLTATFPGSGTTVTVSDARAGERITVREDGTISR